MKKIFLILTVGILLIVTANTSAIQGRYMGYGWCAICGRDMPASHDFTHGAGSGGGGGGYNSYNDPFIQAMTPIMQSMFEQIGQDFAKSMFGDPVEEARQRAIREEEERRRAEEARWRAAELARQREIAHQKLMKSLKHFGTTGAGLQLKSLTAGGLDFDGKKMGGLKLKRMDDEPVELRPGGSSFFGLGGGSDVSLGNGGQPLAHNDPMVVDLRDYRRTSFLAQAANNAAPEDQKFLVDEAVRAADGDTSFVAEPPEGTPVAENEQKFLEFQKTNKNYREAQHDFVAASARENLAQRRVKVAEEGVRRTQKELDQLVAKGTDPSIIANKRKYLQEIQKALAISQEELKEAEQETRIAKDVHVLIGWGRRQQVISLGGGRPEPLSEEQKESLSKLQRVYGRMKEPPNPYIAGWTKRAEAGRRAFKQIERFENTIALNPELNKEALEPHLKQAKHKAEMMDYYDKIINARTLERTEAMRELTVIRGKAEVKFKQFSDEALGTIEGAVGDFRSAANVVLGDPTLAGAKEMLDLNDKLQNAKGIADDIKRMRGLIQTGQADFETRSKLVERTSSLSISLVKDMDLLKSKHPEVAKRILGRSAFWVKAGHGLARTTNHTMDLLQLHQDTRLTSDNLGEWAKHGAKIQKIYKKQVDGYITERNELNKMLPMGTK